MGIRARISPTVVIALAGLAATLMVEFAMFESARSWRTTSGNTRSLPDADLRVKIWGSGLRVSWTPGSSSVRSSRAGALLIADGELPVERLALDPVQLASGEFFYSPKSPVVRFRLDVGRPLRSVGSVIAVLGDRQSMAMR